MESLLHRQYFDGEDMLLGLCVVASHSFSPKTLVPREICIAGFGQKDICSKMKGEGWKMMRRMGEIKIKERIMSSNELRCDGFGELGAAFMRRTILVDDLYCLCLDMNYHT